MAGDSQKKARKEWEKEKPPRKVEPLPRGKVQERKKENRNALDSEGWFLTIASALSARVSHFRRLIRCMVSDLRIENAVVFLHHWAGKVGLQCVPP